LQGNGAATDVVLHGDIAWLGTCNGGIWKTMNIHTGNTQLNIYWDRKSGLLLHHVDTLLDFLFIFFFFQLLLFGFQLVILSVVIPLQH
jgi:hypothetical protein